MREYFGVIRKFALSGALAAAFLLWAPAPALALDCFQHCSGCTIGYFGCDECVGTDCNLQGFNCDTVCWLCPGMEEPQCS